MNYFRSIVCMIACLGGSLLMTGQNISSSQTINSPQLPKESLQLPATLDLELEQLLQRWYEGYEMRNGVPMAIATPAPVPNVADSVYIRMMNHIPSGIRLSYNSVVRESIELYLFRRRPLLSAMMSLGDLYFPDIEAELDRHHLPLELKYLTIVESALNPSAISPAGAAGLWQFMLPSARIYGLTVNSLVDERMDPVKGTEAACKMLSDLYRIYKDWWLVMAAYNCGPGNVNRALARAGGSGKTFWDIYNYLPRETRKYVPLYIGVYFAMHYAKQYGIRPRELGRTLATEYYQVKHEVSFSKIAELTGLSVEQIKAYNPQFRRGLVPWNAEPYQLRLPLKAVLKLEGYNPEEIRSHEMSVKEEGLSISSAPQVASNSKQYSYHRVGRRETVETIARKYGVTTKEIRQWNGLGRKGIRSGMRIIVGVKETAAAKERTAVIDSTNISSKAITSAPVSKEPSKSETPKSKAKKAPKTHTIKKGETLHAISRKYDIPLDELKQINHIKGNNIQIGQTIKVSK